MAGFYGQCSFPRVLKSSNHRCDWKNVFCRSWVPLHYHNKLIESGKAIPTWIRHSDEIWTMYRCIAMLFLVYSYIRYFIFDDHGGIIYLTNQIGIGTLVLSVITCILQVWALVVLRRKRESLSLSSTPSTSFFPSEPYRIPFLIRILTTVKQIIQHIVVPINVVVCIVYWAVLARNDPYPHSFENWMVHAVGGFVVQIDWVLENTFYFFWSMWVLILYAIVYAAQLQYYEVSHGESLYKGIDLSTDGLMLIAFTLLAILPSLAGLMTVIKFNRTRSFCRELSLQTNRGDQMVITGVPSISEVIDFDGYGGASILLAYKSPL
eukprot:GHVH01000836.1.p1 GENE.GHVH01000836.1~~GHVH01000836.1.p1  ORF type:complete len:321 (-),score=12.38 GHVH01000836.1:120-1082(-)